MTKLKIQTKKVIDVSDWDMYVIKIYGRPYSFQQQDGCKQRGKESFTVPGADCDYKHDTVPEEVNHEVMGVSFKAWLTRNPKQKLQGQKNAYELEMWWARNFYPDVQMIANDLHAQGLLEAGEYVINIDW